MILLNVPFHEKDQAKQLGARWDSINRSWYIPDELETQSDLFQRWLPTDMQLPLGDAVLQFEKESSYQEVKEKGVALSALLKDVQLAIRQRFAGARWVVAEVANLNVRRGHVYLELTESNAQGQTVASCRAMIWQRQAEPLMQQFEHETGSAFSAGQKVLLLVEATFHEQYGFSLVIQDIDASYTLGALEQNLIQLRKQLTLEGVFTLNKQFVLAKDFFRIAVLAPPDAAGLGDFRADADQLQSHGLCHFQYFYSAFQGDAVESEFTSAFEAMLAIHKTKPFDALVIIRGGGAKLDLNVLNQYRLARVVCDAPLPVLTGIGHERDNTILDEVAHSRFDTPSKVISYIRQQIVQQAQQAKLHWQQIEHASQLRVQFIHRDIENLNQQIQYRSQQQLNRWQHLLEPLIQKIESAGARKAQLIKHQVDTLQLQLQSNIQRQLQREKQLLDGQMQQIERDAVRVLSMQKNQIQQWMALILSSGPSTQLQRGFSLVTDKVSGKPITSAEQAIRVPQVNLQFEDGVVQATIEQSGGVLPVKKEEIL